MQAECLYVHISGNLFYYIHILLTLRISLQFQCRWPGDHTQNHNFSNIYLVDLELIYSISHYY